MRFIRCPKCNKQLPAWAHYCSACGESLASPTQELLLAKGSKVLKSQNADAVPNSPSTFNNPQISIMEADELEAGEQLEVSPIGPEDISIQRIMEGLWEPPTPSGASTNGNGRLTQEHDELEDTIEDAWHSRTNWHKDVIASSAIIDRPAGGETPPGLLIPPSSLAARRRMPSGMLFWVSMLLLFGLVMGGLFGVVVTLGRGVLTPPMPHHADPSLQVTPSSIALGALISLRGSNFTPKGRIGLSYDANIPIVDTDGKSIILADAAGNFTDTVIVEPEWLAGPHIIHAEDATLHKIASFTVLVTGSSPSLRPAHLRLSADAVDLGSGDQATNSMQSLTLMNMGGGLVTWQAAVTQPWLMVSPKNGTFANNQSVQVVIAANRSNLTPGSYTGSVIFLSNAGQINLPVKMEVTPLRPGPQPILQLTPAVLALSATDGGTNPSGQVVTISNPGAQSLQWSATSTSTSPIYRGSGPDWLSISPRSGSVTQGASEAVTIGANISALLPGVYNGKVTFTSQGSEAVKGSPQSVYVSLTVLPQCLLQVSPGMLSFASVQSQPASMAKSVDLSVSQGCSAPLNWSATTTTDNGGHWLNVDGQGNANGTTPANPSVSVNVAGLAPGIYTGAVVFSSTTGTQTLPVTLTIAQPATPIMLTAPAAMAFNAVVGQSSPDKQTITITNSGGGTLTWNATTATDVGGSWLAISPVTGMLSAHQSASLTVSATLLPSLTPDLYNGMITITGFDSTGNPAPSSPQQIPITFRVQGACSIAVAPTTLSFTGAASQSGAETRVVTINANGACGHRLDWIATVTTSDGGTWLTTTPTTGQVDQGNVSTTQVGVVLTGLAARTYTGTVSISAIDSVTHQQVGTPQTIAVTLMVQPPCTLQVPSPTQETFNVEGGSNPAPQTFTIGIIGNCSGDVTITPTVTLTSGTGWLRVTPATATIHEGSATFQVTVVSTSLPAATYTGSISLSAVNQGIAINGSPQTVGVTLNALTPPTLSVDPGSLVFNVSAGVATQTLTISNTGSAPLRWMAGLAPDAPSFVRLVASPNTVLAGGANVEVKVIVDGMGLAGGTTYTTTVVVRAIDPLTGAAIPGSPTTIPITIHVASPVPSPVPLPVASPVPSRVPSPVASPALRVSSSLLFFRVVSGTVSTPQSVVVTNPGADPITWTASVPPDAPWLQVSPASDSEAPGATSTITFTVDATHLQPGVYSTVVTITPAGGTPIKVIVRLRVSTSPSSTSATPAATSIVPATPATTSTPAATSTATPTASP